MTACIRKTDIITLRDDNLIGDVAFIEFSQYPCVDHPLTFDEVLDIAFAYNLDMYAQKFERDAQASIANAEHLRMLPSFSLDAFYNVRSQNTASVSKTLFPDDVASVTTTSSGVNAQFPQISSLKTTFQDDVRATINFLDMGLAYFQAKQEKDRTLTIEQQHLRARQKLILDISEAYWRAVTVKKSVNELIAVIDSTKAFQETIARQIDRRVLSELDGLQTASRLANLQIQLEAFRFDYQNALTQVKGLMGVAPDFCLDLADVEIKVEDIPECDTSKMEDEALKMRPELFVRDLEERISLERAKQSIFSMLPNSAVYYDNNYDANPFLIHNYWWSLGARATWNILSIPQLYQQKRSAMAQKKFAHTSRIALSITVIAQVRLAYINYQDALNQYRTFLNAYEIRKRLAEISVIVQRAGEFQAIDVLNFRSDALLGQINLMRAYANLKLAEEQLNYAIGRPFYIASLRHVECENTYESHESQYSVDPVVLDNSEEDY